MDHHLSGRLHWDTTHTAIPGWLLFLDRLPSDAPTMLTGFATDVPRDANHAEIGHLIGEMLYRETGQLPLEVKVTPLEDGTGYTFVATYEGPA